MKIINNYCLISAIMNDYINNYTYMYQQLYILSDCLCKETNKNINNYICYSILYKKYDINVVLYMIGIILAKNNAKYLLIVDHTNFIILPYPFFFTYNK